MFKQIEYNESARAKILEGIDAVADAVKVTLGPQGRNVIINRSPQPLHLTKDGYTVANEIKFSDPAKDIGAQLIREGAARSNESAGDGTTTTTVLAQALIHEGLEAISEGTNPVAIKNMFDAALLVIRDKIKEKSITLDSSDQLRNIAVISANNDHEIGNLIADTLDKIGKDAIIKIENSIDHTTTTEIKEGVSFDKGYVSPYFINNIESRTVEYDDALILFTDAKINLVKTDILDAMNYAARNKKPLVIVAKEINDGSIKTIVTNRQRGMEIALVMAPEYGLTRTAVLHDLAAYTGGMAISPENAIEFKDFAPSLFGEAKKVIIEENTTTIIGSYRDEEQEAELNKRKAMIKAQANNKSNSPYEKKKFEERLASLSGKIAVINVGGTTEPEQKEKKDRVEDAIRATKSAVEEGIVAGGGLTLFNIAMELEREFPIINKALMSLVFQIAYNAGKDTDEVMKETFNSKQEIGYNAKTDKYENLLEAGVIDPSKVTRNAVENALSIAGVFLTTECSIVSER